MHRILSQLLISAAATLIFSGCASLARDPSKPAGPDQPAPSAQPAPTGGAPYSISAAAVGPCVNFTIQNTGSTALRIEPANFALIPKGTHRVVPYSTQNATVDVPETCAPGQSIQGRAIFKEFTAPAGNRLVFKPDAKGTFAVISSGAGAGESPNEN